jgi:hypothetical protein
MKMYLKIHLCVIRTFFLIFVCFPEFYEPLNETHKMQMFLGGGITNFTKIIKNQQILAFGEKSCDIYLVETIKYLVY